MIAALRRTFSFPLLGKEMIERAARRRTYVLRALFGLLLVGWFALEMRKLGSAGGFANADNPALAMLGIGRKLFGQLTLVLCWSILIFQPALMAGTLTQEKERGSLELLLLTNVSPTKLLLEKFLAGLLPMATLLLFGLPLGAVAYAYGGVTPAMLAGAGAVLLGAWLQVGAFALLCSAWFRTTTAAVVASYLLLATFYLASEWTYGRWARRQYAKSSNKNVEESVKRFVNSLSSSSRSWNDSDNGTIQPQTTLQPQSKAESFAWGEWLPTTFFPPFLLLQSTGVHHPTLSFPDLSWVYDYNSGRDTPIADVTDWRKAQPRLLIGNLPLFIFSALFFLLARLFLLRRAFAPPRRIWPRLFAWLDGLFDRTNRRFGGVTFGGDRLALLQNSPLLWREATSGLFAQPRHLVRIGLVMLAVALLVPMATAVVSLGEFAPVRSVTRLSSHLAIVTACLILAVRAVGLFGRERSQQTLEVLLTTPLSREEIVREKMRPLTWLAWALFIPLVLAAPTQLLWLSSSEFTGYTRDAILLGDAYVPFCFAVAVAGLWVLFGEIRWVATWIGLRVMAQSRAILVLLAVLGLWWAVPWLVAKAASYTEMHKARLAWTELLTPTGLLRVNEEGAFTDLAFAAFTRDGFEILSTKASPWGQITDVKSAPASLRAMPVFVACAALLFHTIILRLFRALCLRRAERYLHRT